MGKFFGILLLIIIGLAVVFLINLAIDGIIILCKKLGKKIRLAIGIPFKEEEVPKEDEVPKEEEVPKQNNADLLKNILAKHKNSTSDVEHPADEPSTIEVTDFEIKK